MQLKKIQTRIFCGQKPKVFIKIKYPEQVAEPESCVTVRIFLFGAVSSKKRYLPTAPSGNLGIRCPEVEITYVIMRVYSRSSLSKPYTSRIDLSCSVSMLVIFIR